MTVDQELYAKSEMVLVITFCMRQYRLKMTAEYYTWFPNVVIDMVCPICFGKREWK